MSRGLTFAVIAGFIFFSGCDARRVFEENIEFKDRSWPVNEIAEFDFTINPETINYNLYYTVRNSNDYPWSRIFITYFLIDSTGQELEKKLVSNFLFDQKSGKPFGSSGIGDMYDHRFIFLENFKFPHAGKYTIRFKHYMRNEDLEGIVYVGLRVEMAQ